MSGVSWIPDEHIVLLTSGDFLKKTYQAKGGYTYQVKSV